MTADEMTDIDVQARINTYNYYSHYLQSGEQTTGTRKVLQSWFVMQYLVYLLSIFTDVVSVVKPVFKGNIREDMWDISTRSAHIVYGILSILVSYLLAIWMVDVHREYHKQIPSSDRHNPSPGLTGQQRREADQMLYHGSCPAEDRALHGI